MNTLDKALEDIRVCAKSFRIIHAMRGNDSCNSTESIPPSFLFKMKDYKKIIFDHEEDMKNRVSYVKNQKNGITYKIFNSFLKKKNSWEVTMPNYSRKYFGSQSAAIRFVESRTKREPCLPRPYRGNSAFDILMAIRDRYS
jgi:hypothetical protein